MSPRSGWRCITETRAEAGLFFWQSFRTHDREINADLDATDFLPTLRFVLPLRYQPTEPVENYFT